MCGGDCDSIFWYLYHKEKILMATTMFDTGLSSTPEISASRAPIINMAPKTALDAVSLQRNIAIGAAIILSGFLIYFFAKNRR